MQHTIRIVSRRTGVTEHVIRVWERRYGALAPCRCEKNRRVYSEEDIERLLLLRELIEFGHRIGTIASMCTDTLRAMREKEKTLNPVSSSVQCAVEMRRMCHEAVDAHDAEALRGILEHARREFGHRAALRLLVAPLVVEIGDRWRMGTLREGEEHLHTMVVRDFLSMPIPGAQVARGASEMVAATPAGTAHELGILIAAATARDLGWRVTYLGPSLPASEIARIAQSRKARAVALSVVHPARCEVVQAEIRTLRTALPAESTLIIGGRAAESYRECLGVMDGIHWCQGLDDLENFLLKAG